ncbi:MAG TPA: EAL domain-containing protein, partial [Geminicoccaceae bacterium]|nr:EAL domain-containing protein [Geminicoccaceae bacterium]
EALVRWRHPERGLVPPGEFIPVAETSGRIRPLGAWVLGDACRQAKLWQARGQARVVAVNLSPVQLRHPDMLAAIDHVLRRHELEPRWLELEITESLLVEPFDGVVDRNLRGLAARGVQLAIDDLGVGYSSLAYLKRLPAAKLKVDRSFIREIGADPDDEALVRAIVSLGHSLGKRVVAEGIETEPQMEFLRGVSCDIGQGFLLARPQDAAALDAALAPAG